LDFLVECLTAQPERHAVVAMHHHCTLSQSEWLDTMVIENREELFARLRPFPQVKLILTGHIHQVLETEKQGINILSVPSTCFQFKPRCKNFTLDRIAPGYRVINLHPDGSIDSQVHRLHTQQIELHNHTAGY